MPQKGAFKNMAYINYIVSREKCSCVWNIINFLPFLQLHSENFLYSSVVPVVKKCLGEGVALGSILCIQFFILCQFSVNRLHFCVFSLFANIYIFIWITDFFHAFSSSIKNTWGFTSMQSQKTRSKKSNIQAQMSLASSLCQFKLFF